MRVMVIGAGLGGLTLAHGLRQAGIDVVVYEADGEDGRPQGVSLHLDDRGSTALRACLPPEHFAMVEATMGGLRDRTLVVSQVDGNFAVAGARPSDGGPGRARPGRQVSRRLLRAVLLHGLDAVTRFGARFTRFEQRAEGVRAWFADGRTDYADLLVGADGVGSAVRRQFLPHARVVDTGKRMLMGATPLRALDGNGLPELIGDNPGLVRVRDTTVVLGVLRHTRRPTDARDHWLPTLRASAVTEAEDFTMWAIPTTQDRLDTASAPQLARDLAADTHPALRQVIGEAWPEVTVPLRIGEIPPIAPWPCGRVTLLGDAIHLAPGFGGNLAMRDARWLCDALAETHGGRRELLASIRGYEESLRRESLPGLGSSGERTGPPAESDTARAAVAGPGV